MYFSKQSLKLGFMVPTYPEIPTYKLYGEDQGWPTPELLHHESIAERSIIHDWNIRPHRHHDLFQILYIRSGSARVFIDGLESDAKLPCLLTISAFCVHGFRFSEDIDGHVVTLPDFALKKFLSAASGTLENFTTPQVLELTDPKDRSEIDVHFEQLAREFTGDAPARLLALEARLGLILVWAARAIASRQEQEHVIKGRTVQHLRRFHELIETSFKKGISIENYAAALGITSAQLNHSCRTHASKSAQQIVHERIILEAKRNLIYTIMTVSEIAYALGFDDPAYFSRFFSKRTGCAPSEFRINRALVPGSGDEGKAVARPKRVAPISRCKV